MSFEVVSVDKCYAIEAEAKGDILETQMVEGEILYTFAAFPGSPFNDAMYQVRAKKVFRLWLDVLAELPMGQTLTLWSVVLDEFGNLFMHTYIGQIDNARLPRACKIQGKG